MVSVEAYKKSLESTALMYFILIQIGLCGFVLYSVMGLTDNNFLLSVIITLPILITAYILKPALVIKLSPTPPEGKWTFYENGQFVIVDQPKI